MKDFCKPCRVSHATAKGHDNWIGMQSLSHWFIHCFGARESAPSSCRPCAFVGASTGAVLPGLSEKLRVVHSPNCSVATGCRHRNKLS